MTIKKLLNMKLPKSKLFPALVGGTVLFLVVGMTYLLKPCWLSDCKTDDFDPKLTFQDYCEDQGQRYAAAWKTIEALQALTRTQDCEQTWKSLSDINALYLDGRSLESLAPLAHMDQLIFLNVRKNKISDLRPLAGLRNLVSLKLEANAVANIETLAALDNLQSLDLSSNPIENIQDLKKLSKLSILRLDQTRVEDFSALENLTQLTSYDFFKGLSLSSTPAERVGFSQSTSCQKKNLASPALRQLCQIKIAGK